MPGTSLAIAAGANVGKRIAGFFARKIGKKGAKRAVVAVASGVAVDRVVATGGGGGGIQWPTGNLSPFEPGRGIFGRSGGRGRVQAGEMGACPPGYHLNKSSLGDGTPARSVCVRNRSMNFANGRAAGRAGRRLHGTVKMLRKSFTMVTGSAPKGKFIPKRKK